MLEIPAAILPEQIEYYLALMMAGFFVGIWGHLIHSRWTVAVGVILVFLATLLLPLAANIFGDRPELPPGPRIYSP